MDQLAGPELRAGGQLWGSVWGERLWHWLRGEDFEMSETEHLKSISHSACAGPGDAHGGESMGGGAQAAPQGGDAAALAWLWASTIGLAVGFCGAARARMRR